MVFSSVFELLNHGFNQDTATNENKGLKPLVSMVFSSVFELLNHGFCFKLLAQKLMTPATPAADEYCEPSPK